MACDRDKRGCGRPTMSFHLKHACGAGKTFFDSRFMDLHFERGVSRLLHAEYHAPVSVLRLGRHVTRLCRDDKAMLDEHTTSTP